jgi:hypothetical protein
MHTRSQARVNAYYTAAEVLEDIDELALDFNTVPDDTIIATGCGDSDDESGFDIDETIDIDSGGYIEDDDNEFQDDINRDVDQDENMLELLKGSKLVVPEAERGLGR